MLINRLVLRLGLVRFATSLLFILLANVLTRVLIVELQVPAALVTFSFAFQHLMTPVGLLTGYASDAWAINGRHRAPYIWGGMLLSLAVVPLFPWWALAVNGEPGNLVILGMGVLLFSLFGIGTTVSATAINALLVDRTPEAERGAAMTLLWILTLAGFIAGSLFMSFLYPTYNAALLPRIFGLITLLSLALTIVGAWGLEPPQPRPTHREAEAWDMSRTLRFLAGNTQVLMFFLFFMASIFFLAIQTFLLAPFGGEVLHLEVGITSQFGASLTYGILFGMVVLYLLLGEGGHRSAKAVLGVALVLGFLAFLSLGLISFQRAGGWIFPAVWLLGLSRGFYNVGLSHLTMTMAHPAFSGVFMGLWNLVSGLALAAGEMCGGFLKDRLVRLTGSADQAFGWLFLLEGLGLAGCLIFLVPLKHSVYQAGLKGFLARQVAPGKPSRLAGVGGSSREPL
jgi:BCD family chlorophyll transporter-like MFS transporter